MLALLALAVVALVTRAARSKRVDGILEQSQNSSDQLRVRGAYLLLIAFAFAAERLGLEVILGTFIAGVVFRAVDHRRVLLHLNLKRKLEAVGYGVFVPAFFVVSGLQFDLAALLASPVALAQVPLFLLALLIVRGLPALLCRALLSGREVVAAGFFQATSLGFIVVGTQLGMELKLLEPATAAALVAAGMGSLLLFALFALGRSEKGSPGPLALETSQLDQQLGGGLEASVPASDSLTVSRSPRRDRTGADANI